MTSGNQTHTGRTQELRRMGTSRSHENRNGPNLGRGVRSRQQRQLRMGSSQSRLRRFRRIRRHTQPIPGEQMNIHHHDETTKVIHGDCIETMNQMEPASVDAIVTDPPYGLGFMGKKWDDLPPSREWAEACYRVLKPGGHIAAFGGTRTWHRLAVAIEDAGFEMRDSLAWLYGSGFPKSHDVGKAIDKRPGASQHPEFGAALRAAMTAKGYTNTFDVAEAVLGKRTGAVANWIKYQFPEARWWPALRDLLDMDEARCGPVIAEAEREVVGRAAWSNSANHFVPGEDHSQRVQLDITAPATPEAKQWDGWGTALKPAFEPIVLARKTLAEQTVARNVLTHGTGAINVDGCRIDSGARPLIISKSEASTGILGDGLNGSSSGGETTQGRWPANVLLDQHAAAWVDEQSGGQKSGARTPAGGVQKGDVYVLVHKSSGINTFASSEGGASRFFYTAKAPKRERPNVDGVQHPTVKPLAIMEWLIRLVTPPGGTILDPFAGSGTTLEAARNAGFSSIGIEAEETYLPLIDQRLQRSNTNPIEREGAGE